MELFIMMDFNMYDKKNHSSFPFFAWERKSSKNRKF
jgi:hypothetical protein